ncbi:MAG: hypothetical protein HUJ26_00090 [Planctomycetaceae bacterium]|nr:hypothetical protein [Planctomycetaceae bacterium]
MTYSFHDDVLDGSPNIIKNNCTKITLCSTAPTTYAEANATYALADVTVDSTDFTNAAGDVSGRKLTLAAQNTIPVDSTGTSTHIAFLDVANSKLLGVGEHTSQALTSGNDVNIGSYDLYEQRDPAAA